MRYEIATVFDRDLHIPIFCIGVSRRRENAFVRDIFTEFPVSVVLRCIRPPCDRIAELVDQRAVVRLLRYGPSMCAPII